MGLVDPVTSSIPMLLQGAAGSWEDLTLLPVSEVFGPTFQGEGPHAGVRTGFVRLGLCNLTCEWCDTPYTWDRSRFDVDRECPPTAIAEVHARLRAMNVSTVCLSGGEPLVHKRKLERLLAPAWEWHAETNGTIGPPSYWRELVAHTTVSPKVTTRDPAKKRLKWGALEAWNHLAQEEHRAAFKFVCAQPSDLELVDEVVARVGIAPRHVWIMPEGVDANTVIHRHRQLAHDVLARGWNTTTRLHTLLYGQERGR